MTLERLEPELAQRWQKFTQDFRLTLIDPIFKEEITSYAIAVSDLPETLTSFIKLTGWSTPGVDNRREDMLVQLGVTFLGQMELAHEFIFTRHRPLESEDTDSDEEALGLQGRKWLGLLRDMTQCLDSGSSMAIHQQHAAYRILNLPQLTDAYTIIYDYAQKINQF
jgi:hypothetical protein